MSEGREVQSEGDRGEWCQRWGRGGGEGGSWLRFTPAPPSGPQVAEHESRREKTRSEMLRELEDLKAANEQEHQK